MIQLRMPFPISVNQAYAGFKRRFKSKAYKDYEKTSKAYYEENYDHFDPIDGELLVVYKFYSNWRNKNGTVKRKDVCNFEKTLSDELSNLIPWLEDENFWDVRMEKIQSDEEYVDITITKYNFS